MHIPLSEYHITVSLDSETDTIHHVIRDGHGTLVYNMSNRRLTSRNGFALAPTIYLEAALDGKQVIILPDSCSCELHKTINDLRRIKSCEPNEVKAHPTFGSRFRDYLKQLFSKFG